MKIMTGGKNTKENPYFDYLPDYSYYFGSHIYWEGLHKYEGEDEYRVSLGS